MPRPSIKLDTKRLGSIMQAWRPTTSNILLERSLMDHMDISYRLPDHIAADRTSPW